MFEDIKGVVNKEALQNAIDINKDSYSGACVTVALNVMRHLDTFEGDFNIGYHPDMTTPHGIICECDNVGGITGFMAGAARNIVTTCYKDGWKFYLADVISPYDIEGTEYKDRVEKYIDNVVESEFFDVEADDVRQYTEELISRYKENNQPIEENA